MSTLGNRIKQAREFKGLTQIELSEMIGIKQQSLQSAECGDTAMPRKIKQIAEVLEVSLSWLVTGDGDMKTNKSEVDTKIVSMIGQLTKKQKLVVEQFINEIWLENEEVLDEIGDGYLLAKNFRKRHQRHA